MLKAMFAMNLIHAFHEIGVSKRSLPMPIQSSCLRHIIAKAQKSSCLRYAFEIFDLHTIGNRRQEDFKEGIIKSSQTNSFDLPKAKVFDDAFA